MRSEAIVVPWGSLGTFSLQEAVPTGQLGAVSSWARFEADRIGARVCLCFGARALGSLLFSCKNERV
jgi:hypothetical protein